MNPGPSHPDLIGKIVEWIALIDALLLTVTATFPNWLNTEEQQWFLDRFEPDALSATLWRRGCDQLASSFRRQFNGDEVLG